MCVGCVGFEVFGVWDVWGVGCDVGWALRRTFSRGSRRDAMLLNHCHVVSYEYDIFKSLMLMIFIDCVPLFVSLLL